jgi:hypothetical protein
MGMEINSALINRFNQKNLELASALDEENYFLLRLCVLLGPNF